MAEYRIIEEFKAMRKDENNQYTIELVHDSFLELRAEIPGPLGTPYEGGNFSLILDVPELYPLYPPKVRFETNVWHPNILPNSGHICLDILYDNWETDMTLRFVLLAIQFLMTEGNPNDCYNPEAGGQLLNDPNVFHITAKHWTNVYAGGPYEVPECDQKIKFLADQNIDEEVARCILSDENWDVEAALVHYRVYYLEEPTNNLINSMVTSDTHNEELALDTNGVVAAINSTTGENGKQANQRLYEPRERFVITKNVVVIGLAFMIHFTAFHGTSNLQSSVNADKALGTTTLAVIYGSLILSNIFLPMTVISWFGCRLTMALALFAYMPYIAAQFYPRFETLIPAALMVGFGGGPLWCSKCTYLSTVSEALTQVRGNNSRKDVNTVKFFGLFFIFYQMAQVWGNLISSSVLTLSATTTPVNESIEVEPLEASISRVGELCGARFCPGIGAEVNPNLVPPAPEQIQLLNSIFLTCMAGAVVMMIFGVSSLKRYGVKRGDTGDGMSGLKLLTVTINLLRKRRQILMLPITMFIGLEEAFLAVDFTRSFVACGWGISKIGFAMICFGVANAIAAGIAGALVERIGRVTLAAICAVINICLLAYMYSWEAREGDYLSYCTFAAIWGICDGVWLVVVNAFYGILFPNHLIAAYSNFRLWESTGSVIGYIISSQLCTSTKLVILMGVMLIGCVGYGLIEYRVWQKQKNLEAMLSD